MSGQSVVSADIPLPVGSIIYGPSGLVGYSHPDWRGDVRLSTNTSMGILNQDEFAPFGAPYDNTTFSWDNTIRFDGAEMSTIPYVFDSPTRKLHSVQGRWLQPDPAGLAAVNPANPQSWNRYAYVLNNPLSYEDPTGLYCAYLNDAGNGVESIDDSGGSGECGSNGGYWIEGNYGGGSWVNVNSESGLVTGAGYDSSGNLEYSIAGAMGSNTWGAWTQTFSSGSSLISGLSLPNQLAANNGPVTCSTVLPDGSTVGSHVNAVSNQINNAANSAQPVSTPYGPAPSPNLPGPISVASQVYSGTNFRGMYGGPGANYTLLGDAGNFAYFAVSSNIGVPLWTAELVAGGYSITHHPPSDWVGPFGMDPSATRTVSGYGAKCN
jgi:RHS repeat-associated protein